MDEIDDRQQQAGAAEQIAATAAAEVRRQRVELIIVLEKHDEFHLRTRNKIDELVQQFLTIRGMVSDSEVPDDDHNDDDAAERRRQRVKLISILKQNDPRTRNKIDESVEAFLTRTEDDIHDMFCNNNVYDDDDDDDDVDLDSDRDTEAEVETALRFFPEVLSRRGGRCNKYPIQYLATRCKAVSFIPLVARLALEFGLFEEKERGGLLLEDECGDNMLQFLVNDFFIDHHVDDMINREDVDDMYLNVMIQLRQVGYFNREDIQKYGLVLVLCRCRVVSEKRFRFLVEWDPTSLIKTEERTGNLPIHFAMKSFPTIMKSFSTIQDFRIVFEYGIRYYPKRKGISLLFKKNHFNIPHLHIICRTFKSEDVMKVVEDILIRYSDTPINTTEALITAAIDEDIYLDCVYFLLRREPDILQKLLSSKQATVTAMTINGSTNEATSNNCDSEKLKRKRGI
ncbi:hypothetical protein FRACYDRAFT_238555 [Fragilariopsis cylindrus CCMP1102]|uniref:Uncharacterized protein n=1 Tax=Fragilariopsis cylindrus CCMP1102 TaxID=635003 RepID=A0A1E7FIW8_9STRA|nr:hypothetical protein FRACYDRAFT_238555 [Fragilariopsis cylindrus CCMP1102]|eukprot:OEU18121.1 hypothetical protein FRACYDRAFT_238555 [Fragilariopsis cylindrus CCMP1102]